MKNKTEHITKQWVTIADAARFIGVSQDTLRRWEKKGTLIPRRTVGGHRRYSRKQLERVLKQPMAQALEKPHQKITIDKKAYQVQVPPQRTISREDIQTPTNIYVRDTIVSNIIKGNLLTIIIAILIVALLIASYFLLQITREQSVVPLSPVPSYKTLQLH